MYGLNFSQDRGKDILLVLDKNVKAMVEAVRSIEKRLLEKGCLSNPEHFQPFRQQEEGSCGQHELHRETDRQIDVVSETRLL